MTDVQGNVSVFISATTRDSAGDVGFVNNSTPSLHNHPDWQITAADD